MKKNILFYVFAFVFLLIVFFYVGKAYKELINYSELTDRHNIVHNSFQTLLKEIDNAAILNQDLIKAANSSKAAALFYTDSQSIIKQFNFLKATAIDTVNIKILKELDPIIRSEISWILKSDVTDSIENYKGSQHILQFQNLVSLINQGIKRTEFLLTDHEGKSKEILNKIKMWMGIFIFFFGALLVYTIFNLFKQSSKRKIKERELEVSNGSLKKASAQEALLASIITSSDDAIISKTLDGIITSWNPGAERIFGYNEKEMIGNSIYTIIPQLLKSEEKYIISKIKKGEHVEHYETERVKKDGSMINVSLTISAVLDIHRNIIGVSKIARDITENKKAATEIYKLNTELDKKVLERTTELLQSKEQLKEFEHFFNNSNDLSCIANKEGYFEIVNPSFKKLFGYTHNELTIKPFLNFVHPDDISATLYEYDKLKAGALVISFINRYRKYDGSYLWLEWNASPNLVTGKLYCIARDITDRKKAEDALGVLNAELEQKVKERTEEISTREKRFRALIENNYDTISLLNASLEIVYLSPSTFRITGWANEEVENFAGTTNVHQDDIEMVKATLQQVMDNPGKPIHLIYRNLHKKGHYIWLDGVITNLLQDDHVKAIVTNFRDITERIETEETLLKTLFEKDSILESIDDAFFAVDSKWKVTYWNSKAEEMLGKIKKETIGGNLWEIFPESTGSESYKKYHQVVETKQVTRFEDFYPPLAKWYEISAYPSGEGLSVYFKDVTERKNLDTHLKQLNEDLKKHAKELTLSNIELEQFAYIASHDMQEPLRMITSFLTQIEKKYAPILDEKGKMYIDFAVDGAKRMRQIILDLLEFSRVGKTDDRKENVDINGLLEDIMVLYRKQIEEKRAMITVDTMPAIHSYKVPLRQVFQNLIGNALKYVVHGTSPAIHIGVKEQPAHWQFSVSDNGIGIEKEYFDKIFILFQRLHNREEYAGTGMGLAISKKIIDSLGGEIWVESTLGNGATFYFTIIKTDK